MSNLTKLYPLWNSLLYTCSSKHTFTNGILYRKIDCPLSFILRIWILCLHLTSAGFICFKVTRVAYTHLNVADIDTLFEILFWWYIFWKALNGKHFGRLESGKAISYLFEYSLTPSSKFLTVNTRVRNQANLSPRTWSKRCDSQWEQKMILSYLFIHV